MYKNEIDTRPTRGAASSPGPHQTSKKFLWKNVQKFSVNMLTFYSILYCPCHVVILTIIPWEGILLMCEHANSWKREERQ